MDNLDSNVFTFYNQDKFEEFNIKLESKYIMVFEDENDFAHLYKGRILEGTDQEVKSSQDKGKS